MDVITMYTAVLQVTPTGLTPEKRGAWTTCQAGGPGWARGSCTPHPPAHPTAKGPAWMKRKRWVLELERLGLKPGSAIQQLRDFGKLLKFSEPRFLLCKKGSVTALPWGTAMRVKGAESQTSASHTLI